MEVSHLGQRYIGHVALNVAQLYMLLTVNPNLLRYGFGHIRLHADADSWFFQFYVPCLTVSHGSYVWELQLQHPSGLTGVCVAAVSHWLAHWMKCVVF
jgi:hypothetical protein